jgi:hypothetical protein
MHSTRKVGKPAKAVIKALVHWCESAARPGQAACGQENPGSYDTNIEHVTCVKCLNAAKKMAQPAAPPAGQELKRAARRKHEKPKGE